jgi:hypothetical protein
MNAFSQNITALAHVLLHVLQLPFELADPSFFPRQINTLTRILFILAFQCDLELKDLPHVIIEYFLQHVDGFVDSGVR